MTPDRWPHVLEVFNAAVERPAAERGAFLDEACTADADLRREVESLLATYDDDPDFLEDPAARVPEPEVVEDASLDGHRIGPYKILRRIGEGGMGAVYLAVREDQYRKHVALKLVKRGMDSEPILRRFRSERQILALLDHPHIARLLDGGITDQGRPYFVMEYVEDGIPLDAYCDQRKLPIAERLALFQTVCAAVHFAHQNLVVHRDLKPSNILVSKEGRVKLVDFGVAKLLDPDLSPITLALTQPEVRLMTPEYASPEQVKGEAITTASDVYALGVLLYQLLTGHRPYRLKGRATDEIARVICEEDPERPSTAVGRTEEVYDSEGATRTLTPQAVSEARQTQPDRLRRSLSGDLDNIVLKAMQKEPQRRYASAEALTEDVQRYLTGLPVLARPDATWYRAKKFIRRNQVTVGMAAVVFLLVLGFGVVMAVQTARIAQQAHALERERDRVQHEAEKTAQVKTLVSDLFKVVDPNAVQGSPVERLEAASQRVIQDLEDQPELQAELMDEVITIYINLGLYEAVLSMAEASLAVRKAAFGPDDPAIAWGEHRLGEALHLNSRFAEAEAQYQKALALQRAALGDDHIDVARTLVRLSRLYRGAGQLEEAEACAVEALALRRAAYGDTHPATIEALYQFADTQISLATPDAADSLLREVLALQRTVLGGDHPDVAWTLVSLARVALQQQQYDAAEAFLQDARAIYRERYSDDHPDVSRTLSWVGRLHEAQQELDQAEAIYRKTLDARRRRLGNEHTVTAGSMLSLGELLTKRGRYREAEPLLREALFIRRARRGLGHRSTLRAIDALVTLYDGWGRSPQLAEHRRLQAAAHRAQEDAADQTTE